MRALSVLLGATVIAAVVLSGCGVSSPTLPGGNPASAPTIHATVDWLIAQTQLLQSAGLSPDTTISASVDVLKANNAEDSTATVSLLLNGVSYYLYWSGNYGSYVTHTSTIPKSAVKNGDMVVVKVVLGTTTYADSAIMPGGITLANDASGVTWATEGNFDELIIFPLDAQTSMPDLVHPVVSSVEGKGGLSVTADLTSPVAIPQTALTSGQWYEAEVLVQREHIPFAGAAALSDLHVREVYLKDFQKP